MSVGYGAPAARTDAFRRWRRQFTRWANRNHLWSRLEITLVIVALLCGAATYLLLSQRGAPFAITSSHRMTWLILMNIAPVMGLAMLVMRRLVLLLTNRRRGLVGAGLHLRLIGFFSLVAVIPTILLAVFATLLFEFGLQFWFSDRVRTVLENADQVAQAYVVENKDRIRDDILATRVDLDRDAGSLIQNPSQFAEAVQWQAIARDYTEAVVFTLKDGAMDALVAIRRGADSGTRRLAESDVARAQAGELVVLAGENSDRVQAIVQLTRAPGHFLFVSRKTAPQVLEQVKRTEVAKSDYQSLLERRSSLQLRFTVILVIVSLLILFATIWAALALANRWVTPLGWLMRAAERVGKGDLATRVPIRGSPDELSRIARSFNRMAMQLESQTGALMATNAQMDERRRFTEAVLSGVSAGVLGVSSEGVVGLANVSAMNLLRMDDQQLIGRRLSDISPELAAMLETARDAAQDIAAGEVALERHQRTLMVQVRAQGGAHGGYVLTFDDITEQLADQRRAAWSDVARRIAHEIKNPLTPIQLAAERLRRKYMPLIEVDVQVFDNCTDTIIRQVSDLRRMVDEFSAFARMPRPDLKPERLRGVAEQAILLAEMANPQVRFTLTAADPDLTMVCDRGQITQVFTNLIKNSIEAIQARGDGAAGGEITIAIADGPDAIQLRISDDGVGLPPNLRERLTEPYVTTRARGTGLGLAIVKKIIEDHKGRLTLEDRAEGGACAVIEFPKTAVEETAPTTSNEWVSHGA